MGCNVQNLDYRHPGAILDCPMDKTGWVQGGDIYFCHGTRGAFLKAQTLGVRRERHRRAVHVRAKSGRN